MSCHCLVQEGVYRYRLTAWNAYGWSDDALSLECPVSLAADACTEAQSSNLYEPLHVRHARSTKAAPYDAWKSKGWSLVTSAYARARALQHHHRHAGRMLPQRTDTVLDENEPWMHCRHMGLCAGGSRFPSLLEEKEEAAKSSSS